MSEKISHGFETEQRRANGKVCIKKKEGGNEVIVL